MARFSVHTRQNSLRFAIFAQYGGLAEPGTDVCAMHIAGDLLSIHTVISCRSVWENASGENLLVPRPLHNHPEGIALAEKCQTVVSVRSRYTSDNSTGDVCVDGLDHRLVASLVHALDHSAFVVRPSQPHSRARHPDNICNRGISGRGVELDIGYELVSRLLKDADFMAYFSSAVCRGLHSTQFDG